MLPLSMNSIPSTLKKVVVSNHLRNSFRWNDSMPSSLLQPFFVADDDEEEEEEFFDAVEEEEEEEFFDAVEKEEETEPRDLSPRNWRLWKTREEIDDHEGGGGGGDEFFDAEEEEEEALAEQHPYLDLLIPIKHHGDAEPRDLPPTRCLQDEETEPRDLSPRNWQLWKTREETEHHEEEEEEEEEEGVRPKKKQKH